MSRFITEIQLDDPLQAPDPKELSGVITVEVSVERTCRKFDLYCQRGESENAEVNKKMAPKQTVAKWEKWKAGETYSYPFHFELGESIAGQDEENGYAQDWIFLPEIHIIGEFHPDTSNGWIPASNEGAGASYNVHDQLVDEDDDWTALEKQFSDTEATIEAVADDLSDDAVTLIGAESAGALEEVDSALVDMMGEANEDGATARSFYIRIDFDKYDRRYRIGERIAGSVFVRTFEDLDVDQLGLAYQWRTHGRAELKEGELHQILVVEKVKWQEGQRYDYPFDFVLDEGPVTYRGSNQNLDWYLRPVLSTEMDQAEGDRPGDTLESAEEDFLLLPAPTSEMVAEIEQPESSARGIKLGGVEHPTSRHWMWLILAVVVAIIGLTIVLILGIRGGTNFWVLLVGALVAVGVLTWAMLDIFGYKLAETRLGKVDIDVTALSKSDRIQAQVSFQPVREVHIEKVLIRLSVQENITVRQGTGTKTDATSLYFDAMSQKITEKAAPGRPYAVTIKTNRIPERVPVTNSWGSLDTGGKHEVVWTIDISILLVGWFNWDRKIPITVER